MRQRPQQQQSAAAAATYTVCDVVPSPAVAPIRIMYFCTNQTNKVASAAWSNPDFPVIVGERDSTERTRESPPDFLH